MRATKTTSILEGNTFVISDLAGNIDATAAETHGLFAWDTRFLSHWVLTVDGQRPVVMATDDLDYYPAQFFLVPGTGTVYVDPDLSIMRKRSVRDGFREELLIRNEKSEARDLNVRLDAATDFADLFEVKDALAKKGKVYQRVIDGHLILGYCRETFVRETWITCNAPCSMDPKGITFHVHLEPHGQWHAIIDVRVPSALKATPDDATATTTDAGSVGAKELKAWLAGAPTLTCDWAPLVRTYERSLVDLAALRFFPAFVEGAVPAAGLPWFMSIFGRDSLLTSYQALPFIPELATTTLRVLAALQGTRRDEFRDEEPGKILHELRFGEMTAFEERPHSPYYGSADSTPLFLILLDETERWTGDRSLVEDLEIEARAALHWIDAYGDRNGDGYVEYERHMKTGLENQCWKDSWNSMLFADGSMSALPRATCEIQGYVYDAKVRTARLARTFWNDVPLAQRLEREAALLKSRFNEDFWLPDRQTFALAIDGNGRKVDAITSNIGHLLWSGIANPAHGDACVAHLLGDRLFSGWGIRTMAEGEGGYNPVGYHLGTVWPHDNSIIAAGLRRYGFREEAARVAIAILEAATYFDGRLSEAFAGYRRDLTGFPVEYPTACSPQAWASGTPLLMLRTLLGLEPIGDHLLVDSVLPEQIGWLQLLDIPGRWRRTDAFGRGLGGRGLQG